jgi:hypothetical protein
MMALLVIQLSDMIDDREPVGVECSLMTKMLIDTVNQIAGQRGDLLIRMTWLVRLPKHLRTSIKSNCCHHSVVKNGNVISMIQNLPMESVRRFSLVSQIL